MMHSPAAIAATSSLTSACSFLPPALPGIFPVVYEAASGKTPATVPSAGLGNTAGTDTTDGDTQTYWEVSTSRLSADAPVTLAVDLGASHEIYAIVATFANTRPAAMAIERSNDGGENWWAYQYFSDDCRADFGMPPLRVPANITHVICTARDSHNSAGQVSSPFHLLDARTVDVHATTHLNHSAVPFTCSLLNLPNICTFTYLCLGELFAFLVTPSGRARESRAVGAAVRHHGRRRVRLLARGTGPAPHRPCPGRSRDAAVEQVSRHSMWGLVAVSVHRGCTRVGVIVC